MTNQLSKKCFVIMPFSVKEIDRERYVDPNHWNEVYEGLILPAIEEAGLEPDRDDQDTGSRVIVQGILKKLEDADLILCDLSSHNANVYLELGWALRADKPFVLIKDDFTDHSFDLNQQYTFSYSHALKPRALRHEISKLAGVIRDTLNDSERRYSLVQRIGISVSRGKSLDEAGFERRILSNLHRKSGGRDLTLPLHDFPWPELLRRAMTIMFAVKKEIQQFQISDRQPRLVSKLSSLLEELGALGKREIQVGVIDEERTWLFHDSFDLIGQKADVGTFERIFQDIFKYSHGALAWVDKGSNLPRTFTPSTYKRLNIGLFSAIDDLGWKTLVETHHELEGTSDKGPGKTQFRW